MKANNSIVSAPKEKKSFSAVITGDQMQSLIKKTMGSPQAAARLTSTLISAVNASEQLRSCTPASIISAALRGEGQGLIYGHGYYIVPYGSTATYITGYKGYIALALATGMYADIDVADVREGERRGRDRRTGRPVIDLSVYDSDEERDQHPVVGYKAYFELKDGYYREEYWTVDELLRHADRYSKGFSLETYNKLVNGELTEAEAKRVLGGSPWYDYMGGQDKMMRKTALRSLLNSGYAPLSNELRSLFAQEPQGGDGVIPDFDLEPTAVAVRDAEETAPHEAAGSPLTATTAPEASGTADSENAAVRNSAGRRATAKGIDVSAAEDAAFAESFFDE